MEKNNNNESTKFIQGKKKTRGELRLPNLYFVAVDDWIEKIGNDAFCAWLKMYTWADRSNKLRDADAIPKSQRQIIKKLGIGPTTYYDKIIRPLWNYGFIDLQEVEINNNKIINIIVYEYPQNNARNDKKMLKKIRDWDTDYQSEAKERGKRKSITKADKSTSDRGVTQSVTRKKEDESVTQSVTGGVTQSVTPKEGVTEKITPQGVLLNEERGVTEPVHNNVLESINVLNKDFDDDDDLYVLGKLLNQVNQEGLIKHPEWVEGIRSFVLSRSQTYEIHFAPVLRKACLHAVQPTADAFRKFLETTWENHFRTKQLEPIKKEKSSNRSMPKTKKDTLPEWIANQESIPRNSTKEEADPEKQREIDELLRALGEID